MTGSKPLQLCCSSDEAAATGNRGQWLFVMDRYDTLNLETETSLLLMDALIAKGQTVLWTEMHGIYLDHASLRAGVREVRSVGPLTLAPPEDISLAAIDAVLVRKDPPFDAGYLHLTYLLDHLDRHVAQFNSVSALRNLNEKLLPLRWPHLTPPTLVTMSMSAAFKFLAAQGEIVVKPLDDCSGRGVIRISSADPDPGAVLAKAFSDAAGSPRYLIAQAFIPAVVDGDKRVFLVNGKAIGAVNRVPPDGEFLANIHQGARCEATSLSEGEEAAIAEVGEFLRSQGVILAGLDFIGGLITEINITSPSAIRQIDNVSGTSLGHEIVDAMIEHAMIEHIGASRGSSAVSACCLAAA